MRFRPAPLTTLLAVLLLAALAACNGKASTTLINLEEAEAENDAGPDSSVPPPPAPSSFDTLFRTLLADLAAQPAERRPFIRYLGLAHRRGAGPSEGELTAERATLSLMLNSASTGAALAPAVAVDPEAVLYRIDLRDYGWARELAVAGVTHRDGWEALIAGNPYAVTFSGSDADELGRLANTAVAFVYAESVVQALASGDLYHELAAVPALLDSEPSAWGFDRVALLGELEVVRAGNVQGAHVKRGDEVIVDRYRVPETGQPIWLFNALDGSGSDSIYSDPFEVYGDRETFVAFSLPNGLLGYGTYGDDGKRMTGSVSVPEIANPRSCFGCHVEGPVRMLDTIRSIVERNLREYDNETSTAVVAVYPPQPELDAIFASDQAAYRAHLTNLGIPSALGADVITATLDRFERPLSLNQAAAELGVQPGTLASFIDHLGPELAGLAAGGEVSRSDFSRVFAASLCSLYFDETGHRPVTANCPRR